MTADRALVVAAVVLLAVAGVSGSTAALAEPGDASAVAETSAPAVADARGSPARANGGAAGTPARAGVDAPPTYVEENVTEDATWTPENGPYYVSRDVTVESGATLTVAPGTTVNLGEEVTVRVEGSLIAAGSADAPVAFTSAAPSSPADRWQTIEYAGGSGSTLRFEHAVVEYGTTAVTATSGEGAIRVRESTVRNHVRSGLAVRERSGAPSVTVAGSRFSNLGRAGVVFDTGETNPYLDRVRGVTVRNSEFAAVGTSGVLVRAREISDVAVREVTVVGAGGAGVAFETESTDAPARPSRHYADDVAVRGTTVVDAGGDGVRFQGGALRDVAVAGSEVRNASGAGIHVADATDIEGGRFAANTVVDSGTGLRVVLERPAGSLRHVSLSVAGNEFARSDGDGVDVDLGYVVVDRLGVRNNTVTANGDTGVGVSGIRVRGVDVTGNRLAGNAGDGLSVRAYDVLAGLDVGRNEVLDNDAFGVDLAGDRAGTAPNVVHNNTVGANADGVRVVGPAPTRLRDNAIVLNTAARERRGGGAQSAGAIGVVVDSRPAAVELARNDVYGHITGLHSTANGTVVAEHNYWGAPSGPYHATLNPDGRGNAVVTERGKADPVPFASEPFGPRYERPTAVLVANESTVAPGEPVAFSASQSTDDGRLAAYYFAVDGDRVAVTESATHVTSFAEPGTYRVALAVEDAMGVRSLNGAAVNVTVRASQATATPEPTTIAPGTPPTSTTTAPPTGDGGDGSLLESLFSLWGALGGLCYAAALGLGAYGMALTLRGRDPPVDGVTIHALAALGVLTWATAGVLGDGALVTLAGVGAAAWGAATGVAFLAAMR